MSDGAGHREVREGRWQTWLIRGVALLTALYTTYYLGWRWFETLNPDALWLSVLLAGAETWGFYGFLAFLFHGWARAERPPVDAPEGLDVAVFITTYDEPLPVVRKTAVAAREIEYPHTTWILDDGCRPEIRELADRLGVRYIERESSEHAKAGNLNNALGMTSEDFVLQLDADHVPLPHILHRLLGYFEDPEVAFVQSPQDFYNLDSFTHVVDADDRRMWEEQRIFYDIIQPGKDWWNAAFFVGSCAVIRRTALEDVGGISTETITEDVETSIKIHGRGWKSVYVGESLAFGLSPGSAGAYQVQRLRWGQGSMQILRKFNPLTWPGLSVPQRISYFTSLAHYFDGLQKVVFMAAPLVFFLFGILPIRALNTEFLARFIPYVFLMLLSFELLARGRGYIWLSERYNMAKWPAYVRAVWGLFTTKRLEFEVTPKGDESTPLGAYLPQLVLLVTSILSLGWATVAHRAGWVEYGAPGWRSAAFLLNAAFLLWNAWFAWIFVKMARAGRGEEDYRFEEEIPVRVHRYDREGLAMAPSRGVTRRIGPARVDVLMAQPPDPGDRVELALDLSSGRHRVRGRVTDVQEIRRSGVRLSEVACQLEDPDLEDELAIELHCLHHAVPARDGRLRYRPDLFEDAVRWFNDRRRKPRRRVGFPAQVGMIESGCRTLAWHDGFLEDLSEEGALLVLDREVPEGAWLKVQVPGTAMSHDGVVRHVSPVSTPRGGRWAVGIERRRSGRP